MTCYGGVLIAYKGAERSFFEQEFKSFMKTYPIFLASSLELKPEREKFEIFIGRQNKRLVKKNVLLQLDIWEDMGAELNKSRKQDDYNQVLHKAEIVLVLFWTKMGKYTLEEFDLAYRRFLDSETGRPLLYVYEKTVAPPREPEHWEKESKREFKNRLLTEKSEQFHSTFDHYAVLESHFLQTLHDLFQNNHLTFGKRAKLQSLKGPLPPTFFIGREEELESISEKFKKKGQLILLNAEGGMGKTTLASKYWYENQYSYGHCAYLFCEGGILNAIIGDGLGMELTGLSDEDRLRQVHLLFNKLGEDFLLFLDNANDAAEIKSFLQEFKGIQANVLITSRWRDVLDVKENEMLLEHLSPKEAKALFLEYYWEKKEGFDQLLDRFLEGLNYHTLLIEVFAKNLREASELGMNLKGFVEELETKGLILEKDNNFEVRSTWTGNVDKKATTTNDILEILYDFSNLKEEERLFLINMSLLPSENYTLEFLIELHYTESKRAFRDSLKTLYRKGWIGGAIGGEKPQYRLSPVIQRLIQIKNKETLWEEGQLIFQKLKELLKYEQEKDNTHTKFTWLPFGRFFAALFREINKEDFNVFLNDLALILSSLGGKSNLLEAKTNLEKALASYIRNFGEDAPAVAICRSNLAMVFGDLGGERNLLEAKTYLEKTLASDIASFGEDAPAVAIRRSNLATVLKDLGWERNLLEAKNHLEKALASDIRNFGEYAPAVAICRSNLATVLKDLGGKSNLLEAKTNLEKALASDIASFGEDAPAVATIRSNLATVLQGLGGERNLLEAKTYLEKALASDNASFGEDAPAVAICRSNLATVLKDLGGKSNLLEAKTNLEKALASDIASFGEDAPAVAIRRSNLAMVFEDLGGERNLLEAKTYLEKTLASDIASFGEDAPAVARCRSNLATVLQGLGGESNLLEAKTHLEKALASGVASFGEDAPAVAIRRSNLALALKRLGGEMNLLEAKTYLEKALASDNASFGEDAPAVAICRSNLATVLRGLGGERNLLEAKNHLEKALASDIRNFGTTHPDTILKKFNLGVNLVGLGQSENLKKALSLFDEALTGYRMNFGDDYYLVPRIFEWIEYLKKKLEEIGEE
jgi:TPR repeat protein